MAYPPGPTLGKSRTSGSRAAIWIIAAFLLGVSTGTSAPGGAHRNGLQRGAALAFERNGQIYVAAAGGQGVHRITRPSVAGGVFDPAWSRDHRRIAFVLFVKEDDNEIGVMRADGSGRRDGVFGFGFAAIAEEPAWSPDGKQIAVAEFLGGPSDKAGIVVARTQAPYEKRELSGYEMRDQDPTWSPDGKLIAFGRQTRRDGPSAVFVVPAAGGSPTKITTGRVPDWAPDGRSIAFVDRSNIYVSRPNGSARRLLVRGVTSFWGPSWSPDGKKLAFIRPRERACAALDCLRDVWTVDQDGRHQRLIVRNGNSVDW